MPSISPVPSIPAASSSGFSAPSTPPIPGGGFHLSDSQFALLLSRLTSPVAPPLNTPSQPLAPSQPAFAVPAFVGGPNSPIPSGESLLDKFPFIPRSTLLEIIRYEFHPLNLHKLDPSAMEKSTEAKNSLVFDEYGLSVKPRTGSHKDYPFFSSLLEPLSIYFKVLTVYAASSNSVANLLSVSEASLSYIRHLTTLSRQYTWSAVLQYHVNFFLKRSRDMSHGDFSGWNTPDHVLLAEHLILHARPLASSKAKSTSSSPSSPSSKPPVAQQYCFGFNKGTCTGDKCPHGRMHKCQKCDSPQAPGSHTCNSSTSRT